MASYDYEQRKGRFGKFDPKKGSEKEQWDRIFPKTPEEIEEEEFRAEQRKARRESIKRAWKEQMWPGKD